MSKHSLYTDEKLTDMGRRLCNLREMQNALAREVHNILKEQDDYIESIGGVLDVYANPPDPEQHKYFAMFERALEMNDANVLFYVYGYCESKGLHLSRWRSEGGESIPVAYRRRMNELGGLTAEMLDAARDQREKEKIAQEKAMAKKTEKTYARRYIFCGDRAWTDRDMIKSVLKLLSPKETLIVHGNCTGADVIAGEIARSLGFDVEVFPYIGALGKAGGPARNKQMLDRITSAGEKGAGVFAFHDDIANSKGTRNMIGLAESAQIPVTVIAH